MQIQQDNDSTAVAIADNEVDLRLDALRRAARALARSEVAEAVSAALNDYEGSLRDLQRETGLDPAFVSKLANGQVNKQGATVASLAQVALALDKNLKITIE